MLGGPATVGHALSHLSGTALLSAGYTAYLASLVGDGVWTSLLAGVLVTAPRRRRRTSTPMTAADVALPARR